MRMSRLSTPKYYINERILQGNKRKIQGEVEWNWRTKDGPDLGVINHSSLPWKCSAKNTAPSINTKVEHKYTIIESIEIMFGRLRRYPRSGIETADHFEALALLHDGISRSFVGTGITELKRSRIGRTELRITNGPDLRPSETGSPSGQRSLAGVSKNLTPSKMIRRCLINCQQKKWYD